MFYSLILFFFLNALRVTLFYFSQSDVDDFVANYPNCTTINGIFRITGPVNDISSLDYISRVEGGFSIDSTEVTEISNFNKLEYVKDRIVIQTNPLLLKVEGFNNMLTLNHCVINNNLVLQEITGFNSLESVKASFYFQGNIELIRIEGFRNLKRIENVLSFYHNPKLYSIPDFNNLEFVGQQLQIVNSAMTEISGFNNVDFIGSNIFGGLSIQFITKL